MVAVCGRLPSHLAAVGAPAAASAQLACYLRNDAPRAVEGVRVQIALLKLAEGKSVPLHAFATSLPPVDGRIAERGG